MVYEFQVVSHSRPGNEEFPLMAQAFIASKRHGLNRNIPSLNSFAPEVARIFVLADDVHYSIHIILFNFYDQFI